MADKRAIILIVDDEKTFIDVLVRFLAGAYKLVIAKNGPQALKMARSDPPPDLILLDIMMPGMKGYEVCRELKQAPETQKIPVVFLSALDEVINITRGFEAGGVDYITKPFHGKEVLARVDTHLQIQTLRRELEKENVRLKTLADATFEGIILHRDGFVLDTNPKTVRLLGCRTEEILGKNLRAFLPPESQIQGSDGEIPPWKGNIRTCRGEAIPVEIHTRTMDPETPPLRVTAIRDLSRERAFEREKQALERENLALKGAMTERFRFGDIIGRSPAMQAVYERIAQAAASDFHVILSGESGTGKELAARTIHGLSLRRKKPFIAVNCGAVAESLFEREFFGHQRGSFTGAGSDQPGYLDAAHDGSLFLDELSELNPAMQVKLLRVLESGEYIPVGGTRAKRANARLISATNQDLAARVREGKFREDLFYRIHVIEITLPPLRERKKDIPLLLDHFLERFSSEETRPRPRIPGKILDALFHHRWPGNVRELQNAVQRYLATGQLSLGGTMSDSSEAAWDADSEMTVPEEKGLGPAVEALEQRMIRDSLGKTGWHRGKAAEVLGIPRRTLQRKMIKYGFRNSKESE